MGISLHSEPTTVSQALGSLSIKTKEVLKNVLAYKIFILSDSQAALNEVSRFQLETGILSTISFQIGR